MDKKKAERTKSTKNTWFLDKKQNTFIIHPKDNQDSDKECNKIDVGIEPILDGHYVDVGDDMETPGLVGDSVELRDKCQNSKSNGFVVYNGTTKTSYDSNMVDGEQRKLSVDDHIHHFADINSN